MIKLSSMEYDEGDNMSYNDESDNDYGDFNDEGEFALNDSDHGIDTDDDNNKSSSLPYTILNEAEIKRRQDEEITYVSSVFSLSIAEATILLCHYNWSKTQLEDDWFSDEQAVRTKVGLLTNSQQSVLRTYTNCGICFDDFPSNEIRSASCGHNYCITCWGSYIDISINDSSAGCLLLRCPEPKCPVAIDRDMVAELASKEAGEKYLGYLIRSYVEFKKLKIKWCPSPGCDNAIEFELGGSDVYDVVCERKHEFCFNCVEEPHRPVECKIVKEWILKNSSEAENVKWITAYCKPCPKCKRSIEKRSGCNHMTCGQPCGHQFCWYCGRDLNRTYSCNCNGFKRSDKNQPKDENSPMEIAKRSLERYSHFFERWDSNNKSRDKALSDLAETKSNKLHILSNMLGQSMASLEFIVKAWEKIVECRRLLKWTYAYGYFLLEHEPTKTQFFEYLQGEAENALERLHSCAERDLHALFNYDEGADLIRHFKVFQSKLLDLTKVTGSFFDNLVRGLENGLSEVWKEPEPEPEPERKIKKKRKNDSSSSSRPRPRSNPRPKIEIHPADLPEAEYWSCDRCSYLNHEWARTCAMCVEGV